MGRSSREKGKTGEREVRDALRGFGFNCRRGLAAAGEPDLVHSIPGVHLEVKRREQYELDEWLRQAESDSGSRIPVVVFRKSRQPWRAVVPLHYLLGLMAAAHTTTNQEDHDAA